MKSTPGKPELVNAKIGSWKVHTPLLLQEIADCSGNTIYKIPLSIFGKLLAEVGERAAAINDPELNALMCRLTIYTVADPTSPDYNPKTERAVMQAARAKAKTRTERTK